MFPFFKSPLAGWRKAGIKIDKVKQRMEADIMKKRLKHQPDPADTAGGQRSRHNLWTLLHEAAHREPQTVTQRVLILQDVSPLPKTRVRIIPLVRAESEKRKHNTL